MVMSWSLRSQGNCSVGLGEAGISIVPYLNRFDAISAYMRKMDRYGLGDFLKISHIR